MSQLIKPIEEFIARLLPINSPKESIEAVAGGGFEAVENDHLAEAYRPAYALLSSGGKRWRPVLMQLCSQLMGKPLTDCVVELSVLPELVHNGTLMVDDIEDGAVLRRGEPCSHIQFGVDCAINTGNLIYFLPTTLIDKAPLSQEVKLKLYQIYSYYMRRVHFGQALDIHWHKTNAIPSQEAYFQMCRLKTGALAAMAAEVGVLLGNGSKEQQKTMGEIAENIGIVFQIADDIINLRTGNKGKNRGDDIVEKKKSLPVILYAQEHDPSALLDLMDFAATHGYEKAKKEISHGVELILNAHCDEKAEAIGESLRQKTLKELETAFESSEARNQIKKMVLQFF